MEAHGLSMVGYVSLPHILDPADVVCCHDRLPFQAVTFPGMVVHEVSTVGYVYHTLYHIDIIYCHARLHTSWIT